MANYKYKLKEEPFKVGDTKTDKGIKTTVKGIDPETGAISWDVNYVPAFDSVFKEFDRYSLPGIDEFTKHMINIPVGWWLTDEERNHIVDFVNNF